MTAARSRLVLLEGSQAYFPALVAAFATARHAIQLETYIFDFHGGSTVVAEALVQAAQRGVQVQLVVDGVGTGSLPAQWQQRFARAGVQCRVFAPPGSFGLLLPRRWRRLHRKLCVVDCHIGFCGGINLLDDLHDPPDGVLTSPRFDMAVRLEGPLVSRMGEAMAQLWARMRATQALRERAFRTAYADLRQAPRTDPVNPSAPDLVAGAGGLAKAELVFRDNFRNRKTIELAYRKAIGEAHQSIVIANAYFLPGGKLRRALVHAVRRGVRVQLLLQVRYEGFMQYHAARPMLDYLLHAGIEIHGYAPSHLHAKIAVIDPDGPRPWATVGSSNLDPLSLLMAREANVVVRDPAFATLLHVRLQRAIREDGQRLDALTFGQRPLAQRALDWLAYALMRGLLWVTGKRY